CEAFVHLTRQSKIGKLKVYKLRLDHNHDCNEVTVSGYPESRRLSDSSKANVLEYSKLKAKPTLVKPLLRQSEGLNKIILSRDISNVRLVVSTKAKLLLRNGRSDEQMLIDKLAEVHAKDPNAVSHIEFDPVSKEVIFILLQTSEMREMLKQFPEVILMDITYKINKNRMPVSVVEVMDEEGLGQVVAYIFLANELKETLTSALMCFADASGKEILDQTNCVVVDKDFSEIGAVKAVMPNAKIHLCSVHVERNLKGAATGEKNRKQAIAAFHDMVYSETDDEFQTHLSKFQEAASVKLYSYFDKNWLKCKEAWALKDRILVKTLRNHTTNRVESHNQKLKMIFSCDTELYDAIDGIVNILMENRRDDLRYRAHETLTKKTYILKCSNPLVSVICNDLSEFAAKLVNEQLSLSGGPSPFPDKYQVSENSCSCSLFMTMELPCRHIMRLRKEKGLPEYDKNIVSKRWWLKPRNFGKSTVEGANSTVIKARMPAQRVACVMNSREKFREIAPLTQKINSLVTDSGTKTFHRRRQVLSDIVQAWSNGEEVSLVHVSHTNQEVFTDIRAQQDSSHDSKY
ncbi:uncharacterized protein LOC113213580, partial [Frankliniella occidentalis]|uniref:Uncharacterized protein LOC113213580 n=1 Tax=Frankliniella occidentalis TaxID=133901 RepID=A0A9C6WYL0_FRAOC